MNNYLIYFITIYFKRQRMSQFDNRTSIRQRNPNRNTDQLYDPLRETFMNPQNVVKNSVLTPVAAKSSFVSNEYKILSPDQIQRLEHNIYIPNTQLYPSQNFSAIRNEKFIAVNANQRILGPAITPQEVQRIRAQGVKKHEVIYQTTRQPQPQTQKINNLPPPEVRQEIVYEYEPAAERYTAQNYDNYGKNQSEYKYNLFSMIDQPVNKCRQFGLQGCSGCPSNNIIAPKNRPLSLGLN